MKPKSNTCLLVVTGKNNKLYMAGDRRVSWDYSQAQSQPFPKILKQDKLLIGGTGDCFLCELFVRSVPFPKIKKDQDALEYMQNEFYSTIIAILEARGMMDNHTKTLKIPSETSAELIVVLKHRLFTIDISNPDPYTQESNGMVTISELGTPYGTGCGGQWAWAAYEALNNNTTMATENKIKAALRLAAKHSPGCDASIDIISE
jgi:ATP-dependent protease HslVU (ClpYQ) peptidase subunit